MVHLQSKKDNFEDLFGDNLLLLCWFWFKWVNLNLFFVPLEWTFILFKTWFEFRQLKSQQRFRLQSTLRRTFAIIWKRMAYFSFYPRSLFFPTFWGERGCKIKKSLENDIFLHAWEKMRRSYIHTPSIVTPQIARRANLLVKEYGDWEGDEEYPKSWKETHNIIALTCAAHTWSFNINQFPLLTWARTPLSWSSCSLPFNHWEITVHTLEVVAWK